MSFTLTLTAATAAELREQILELAAQYAPAVVVEPALKAKSKPVPVKIAEPTPEPETVPELVQEAPRELTPDEDARPAADPVPEPAREVTFADDITPAVLSLVNAKGRDAIISVFKAFGIGRASECDVAKYPELLAALHEAAR